MRYTNRVLAILAAAIIGGCGAMNKNVASVIEQADTAYAQGRFELAEHSYREALHLQSEMGQVEEKLGLIALWKNDLTTAEHYLKAARQHSSWLTRLWPFSIQIDHYLTLLYIRAGRIHEAAELLSKAAGPLPVGPFRPLKIQADQLTLFDDATFYQIDGPVESVIPFVITDPLPVVRVSVNGSEPANFFIDTGGEGIVLDRAFAERAGATIIGEYAGEYAGGKRGMTGFGKIDRVQLGDMTANNVPISTIDLAPTSKYVFDGMEIAGIVGTNFLMHFLSTIDYPNGSLILRRHIETEAAVQSVLGLHGKEHIFPFRLVETHLIFVEGSVNNLANAPMLIDTGLAGAAFMTSKESFAAAGVTMDWSKMSIGAGGGGEVKGLEVEVREVTLGNGDNALRRQHLKGIVTEKDHSLFNGTLGFRVGGLISHQFFRENALSFDFCHMRLIVQ